MKHLRILPYVLATPAVLAWEPATEAPDMPLDLFALPSGLEVTAWAASPDLFNPTNLDIDHRGRIWVTEGVNYRGRANRRPEGDRIVVLEDTNGDGKADRSQVFWQDPELVSPLGIAVFDNVVLVSQPPHLLKLTDVNRDLKFEPENGDTREVLLTGFNGRNHDHSLHSVTAGPDGKWYFNQGNCGGVFTDKSGKTFRIGSAYYRDGGGEWPVDTPAIAGQKSDDGFVYVGGFTVRMNPDATNAEIIGHNYRNSYEQTITSRGHVFQNDNDDPPACRTSHVIEHGSAGFFSRDGKRFWSADRRPGQDVPTAEWRQEDPGIMPAGDIYGGGSPTGVAFYENGALGEKMVGTLFSCEAARNVVFSYQPDPLGAGFGLERVDFLTTNPEKKFDGADFTGGARQENRGSEDGNLKFWFRPSDVCVGPDGALYVADWTDPRVGGHDTQDPHASGVIYRIAPRNFRPQIPEIDPANPAHAITALKSPAVNVRWLGFRMLRDAGEPAYAVVAKVLEDPNPFVAARAIWLMPYLGEKGKAKLHQLLADEDGMVRLTAFRAIRRTDGAIDPLPYAKKLSTDKSPAVRAEAALAMRYLPFDEAREVLVNVAKSWDGEDASYLESLGIGAGHHANELWQALVEEMKPGEATRWSDAFARLTWRLMPAAAVEPLKNRAGDARVSDVQRKLAVDALAFINTREAADALMELAAAGSGVRDQARWWLTNRSEGEWLHFDLRPTLVEKGIIEESAALVEIIVPAKPESTKFSVDDVLALEGDAARGKIAAARCVMCHQIDGQGPDYGPALKGFANRQPPEVIALGIVDPSAEIAHGFAGTAIQLDDGRWIDGLLIADGDPVVIRSTGGITQRVPANRISHRKPMDRSLMLNADQLGLSAQDVADIIEWMKGY